MPNTDANVAVQVGHSHYKFNTFKWPNLSFNLMDISDKESIIMQVVEEDPGINKTNLAGRVKNHMSKDTAAKAIERLVEKGDIIQRREGKAMRHFPYEADDKKLKENLADVLDRQIKNLSDVKDELPTYTYDLLNALHNKISYQSDELKRAKESWENELKFEHGIEDYKHQYKTYRGDVQKLLAKNLVDYPIRNRINMCLKIMQCRVGNSARKRFGLIKQREKYGRGEKRKSLSERIAKLDEDIDEWFFYTSQLYHKLEWMGRTKSGESPNPFGPQPMWMLNSVKQDRKQFQNKVEEVLNDAGKRYADGPEYWRVAESALKNMTTQLTSMENDLVKAEKALHEAFMESISDEQGRELYQFIVKTEKFLGIERTDDRVGII